MRRDGVNKSAVGFLNFFEFDFGKRLNRVGMVFDGLFEDGGFAQFCAARVHFERNKHRIDQSKKVIGANVSTGTS